jgi:hypothetical protein
MVTEPTEDAELARLLNAYALDALDIGAVMGAEGLRLHGDNAVRACKRTASHSAVLHYIASRYISRKEIASRDDRHNY